MEAYANHSGDSGVEAFEIGPESITVRFDTGAVYLYNSSNPGMEHVRRMQQLAVDGKGLNSYISRHVQQDYAVRLG